MRLLINRDVFTSTTTLGVLAILYDGGLAYRKVAGGFAWVPHEAPPVAEAFGFTCEDEDRGLDAAMPLPELRRRKVKAETAIPTPVGAYEVIITKSNRYGCEMPLVVGVPVFDGIRWHPGNTEAHTAGCLLPGTMRDVRRAMVLHSERAFAWLFDRMKECRRRDEGVYVEITRDPTAWADRPPGLMVD